MWTSVFLIRFQKNTVILLTIATLTPIAQTPKDLSTALVIRGTLEMESCVSVCNIFKCV